MNEKQTIRFIAIGFPAFILLMAALFIRASIIVRNFGFNGRVEEVEYNIKGTPTVKIGGHKYCLSDNGWPINNQIQQGDSLIKVKGQMMFKIVKRETGMVIIIKQ